MSPDEIMTATDTETLARPRRVVSMRLILSFAAAALVALSVIALGTVSERNIREMLMSEAEARLLLEASNLAHLSADILLDDFPELTLNPVITDIRAKRGDLELVTVLDHQGLIVGHADVRRYGTRLAVLDSLSPATTSLDLAAGEVFLGNDALLAAAVESRLADGRPVGRAVIGLRRETIEARVAGARRQMVLVSALLLAVGLAATVGFMHVLLRPVAALRAGLERIGHGELDRPMHLRDRTELGLLADTVDEMAARIRASQRDLVEKERLAHEMDLAQDIQQSLLPDSYTSVGDFVIEGAYMAAAEVGGDYFDIFELPDGRHGCIIADVAGKGLGGCLVTSMLAVLIRSLRDRHASPRDLLVGLEEGLQDQLAPGVFVTAFYGILDADAGVLTYASAAHSPLMVCRAADGAVETYETKGIPIGAMRGGLLAGTLEDRTLELAPGDFVLQYTDGLNEAPHEQTEEELGFERVAEILKREAVHGRRTVLTALQQVVRAWTGDRPQSDDLTLLAVSREGAAHRRLADDLAAFGSDQELKDAMADAPHVKLPPEMERLEDIGAWLRDVFPPACIPDEEIELVETGLYELCANIIEHGYTYEGNRRGLDIWWRVEEGEGSDRRCGHFLIRDRGTPFDPEDWTPPDLGDRVERLKGRGLGLLIVDKLVSHKTYLAGTGAGNLYLVRFNALLSGANAEATHV